VAQIFVSETVAAEGMKSCSATGSEVAAAA
jgi:hypothetical protein